MSMTGFELQTYNGRSIRSIVVAIHCPIDLHLYATSSLRINNFYNSPGTKLAS